VLNFRFLKIMATALTVCPLLCVAQSSVNLYGQVEASIRRANNSGPNNAKVNSVDDGYFSGSRFGMKGSEDLGDGLKAMFVLESGFDPSTGTSSQGTASANYGQIAAPAGRLFGRESWIGLSSRTLGTLTLGRQNTVAHAATGRVQPMGNTNNAALTVLSNHHLSRQDNMIVYGKEFGPFSLKGSMTMSEGNGRGGGISGIYSVEGLDVIAYGQNLSSNKDGEVRKIRGAGAAYEFVPKWKLYFDYMTRNDKVSGEANKVATGGLGFNPTPAWYLVLSVTRDQQNRFGANAAGDRRVAWVAANYSMSKRTELYAGVDHNKFTGGYILPTFIATRGSQTGMAVGMRHRF
jgi:predicted porin